MSVNVECWQTLELAAQLAASTLCAFCTQQWTYESRQIYLIRNTQQLSRCLIKNNAMQLHTYILSLTDYMQDNLGKPAPEM